MKDFRDYYRVLGVPRNATVEQIRLAYRRAARRFHPDVNQAPDAAARMAEVNEAHEVLSDAGRRRAYDTYGARHGATEGFQPPPSRPSAAQPRSDPGSAFFSSIFGRRPERPAARSARPGPGGFQAGNPAFRGNDQEASVEITVAEAYRGTTRTISLRNHPEPSAAAAAVTSRGRAGSRTIEVSIPKGVRDGQRLRLAGQGAPSLHGGSPGDLHLEVKLAEDLTLRTEGRDVYQKLPVTPWEAALGAVIVAPTVAGPVELRIPPASQNGRRLRLRGKGLPAAEPGDLFLDLEVVLPPAQNEAAQRLYAQMARDLAFDPRAGMAQAVSQD